MKYSLYSIRDQKVGFMIPQCDQSDASAIRGFSYGINGQDGMMNFSPKDFDLYKIGEFDVDKGIVIGYKTPQLIISGTSVFGDNK